MLPDVPRHSQERVVAPEFDNGPLRKGKSQIGCDRVGTSGLSERIGKHLGAYKLTRRLGRADCHVKLSGRRTRATILEGVPLKSWHMLAPKSYNAFPHSSWIALSHTPQNIEYVTEERRRENLCLLYCEEYLRGERGKNEFAFEHARRVGDG